MPGIWKTWCRLCAKENDDNIDVFVKSENFLSITEAIQKFYSIAITAIDEAPTTICNDCHQSLNDMIAIWVQATKIQEMYAELQFNDKFEILPDLTELRLKYGLNSAASETTVKNSQKTDCLFKQQDNESYKENTYNNEDSGKIDIKFIDQNLLGNCDNSLQNDDENKCAILKLKNKTKKRRESFKSKVTNDNGKDPVAYCDMCEQSFYNKGGYTFHLKSKHLIINEPISCKYCKKTFKAISDHQKHETTHLPPDERKSFPCNECGKKFFSEGNLNSHVRVVHIREKSFICEECGKSFVTVDGLNSHKLVHTDEKPYQCTKCPKSFKRLPTLKLHIDSHEESKYICSICGQQLNSKALLRRHMVVHSDEKKYKCNFCEKEFKRPDAFKHHLILHTGLKPYECPFCEQTFANGSNCRKHQKTSHPQELAIAEEAGLRRVCRNVPKIEQLRAVNAGAAVDATLSV